MPQPLRPLLTHLTRLAAPVAAGRLGVVGMGVVDTIVVGQFAPGELAHQALGWTINGPFLLGGIGLLLGVQVLTARMIGAGKPAATGAIWRRGLLIALVAGACICALAWIAGAAPLVAFGITPALAARGAGVAAILALSIPLHLAFMASTNFLEGLQRPTPGAAAMWAANGVNLALNLVFVPHWGAIGSAWATVASRLFLFAAIAGFILSAPTLRAFLARGAPTKDAGFAALLAIGAAAALSAMIEAGAFATMGVIAARSGATAMATFAIATGGLVTLVFLLAQGFGTAGAVLSSEAIGRGAPADANRIGWSALALTFLATSICGFACTAFAPAVARAFASDAAIVASLAATMGLTALLMIPDGGQGVADLLLRARGDNWTPTALRMAPYVLVAPPLALFLSEQRGLGVAGVLAALIAASLIAFAALLWRLARR